MSGPFKWPYILYNTLTRKRAVTWCKLKKKLERISSSTDTLIFGVVVMSAMGFTASLALWYNSRYHTWGESEVSIVCKQRRIQDFPRGRQLPRGRQHTILPNFPENCMKSKEFGCPGEGASAPRAPSKSATGKGRSTQAKGSTLAPKPTAAITKTKKKQGYQWSHKNA